MELLVTRRLEEHNATDHAPLHSFCNTSLDDLEGMSQLLMLCGSAALMLTLFVGNLFHLLKVTWLPESLVAVSFGALLGFALWASPFGKADHLNFSADYLGFAMYLKLFALPLIIFEAGWSLRLRDFFSQLVYILIFAILGTIVSIAVVASLMVATGDFHGVGDPKTAWAYASLISSVDPVATLATFGHLNVDRLLFILVFGESQINDAVAITMFDAFNSRRADQSAVTLILRTLEYLFGSILLGVALAVAYILILRCGRMSHSPHEEIIFLTVASTFTYQLAELAGMSGIITVLFCAIALGGYAGPHLSANGIMLFSFLLKQLASLCDMLIFLFVGIAAVKVSRKDLALSLWIMLFVLVSRAAAIFPLGLLCNAIKAWVGRHLPAEKRHWISWKHMVMMWHGGVCRGGVSLWMATEMEAWVDEVGGGDARQRLINATFVLICSFLLLFGGTTSCFMRGLDLPMGDQVPADMTLYDSEDKNGWGYRLGMWTHRHFLVPVLVGKVRMERMLGRREEIMASVTEHSRTVSTTFALFGGEDPGHLDHLQDVLDPALDEDSSGDSSGSSE